MSEWKREWKNIMILISNDDDVGFVSASPIPIESSSSCSDQKKEGVGRRQVVASSSLRFW